MTPKPVSDESFDSDVLSADGPVVVDFWAEWCGPCKQIAPTVDELAGEYDGRAVIGKVNVDNHPTIAAEYGIRSIPSLLVFSQGKVQQQIIGVVRKNELTEALDNLI